jgi:hypothetical protein
MPPRLDYLSDTVGPTQWQNPRSGAYHWIDFGPFGRDAAVDAANLLKSSQDALVSALWCALLHMLSYRYV